MSFDFDVAFSFAGQHREKVREIATLVAEEIGRDRVFFDEWRKAVVIGPDMDLFLERVYFERSLMVVSELSEAYADSRWTRAEWRAIRALRFKIDTRDKVKRLRLLSIRMAAGDVPGIFATEGYLDGVKDTASECARGILERLDSLKGRPFVTVAEPLAPLGTQNVGPVSPTKGPNRINLLEKLKEETDRLIKNAERWTEGIYPAFPKASLFRRWLERPNDAEPTQTSLTPADLQGFFAQTPRMVISGGEGAGKSHQLFQLATHLLHRARSDERAPMPLVLFASTWRGEEEMQRASQDPSAAFDQWLMRQLVTKFRVPAKFAGRLGRENIFLLIDGIDEIAQVHALADDPSQAVKATESFLRALAAWLEDHATVGFCLTSRAITPGATPESTKIADLLQSIGPRGWERSELILQYLERKEFNEALENNGVRPEFNDGLWKALQNIGAGPDQKGEAGPDGSGSVSPFLLNTLLIARRGQDEAEFLNIFIGATPPEQNSLLFQRYVSMRLSEGGEGFPHRELFGNAEIRRTLSWIAGRTERRPRTFRIDLLQPDWLLTEAERINGKTSDRAGALRKYRFYYGTLHGLYLCFALVMGIGTGQTIEWYYFSKGMIESPHRLGWAIVYGMGTGLLGGLVATAISSVAYTLGSGYWVLALSHALAFGAARGIMEGFSVRDNGLGVMGLAKGLSEFGSTAAAALVPAVLLFRFANFRVEKIKMVAPTTISPWRAAAAGILSFVTFSLVFYLSTGRITSAVGIGVPAALAVIWLGGKVGVTNPVSDDPNQGFIDSLDSASLGTLILAGCSFISVFLVYAFSEHPDRLKWGAENACLALCVSVCGLLFGFTPVLQHTALRCLLYRQGHTPRMSRLLTFSRLLEHARDIHLLKQVSGSYIFLHDRLRQYFVALLQEK